MHKEHTCLKAFKMNKAECTMQGATIFNLIGAGLPVATVALDGTTPLLNLSHLEVPEIT